jgi:hypothetical protein
LESEEAVRAARAFTLRIVSDPHNAGIVTDSASYLGPGFVPWVLEGFLSKDTRDRRAIAVAAAIGSAAQVPARSIPLLPAAGEPLTCRLSTQDLVELLKMPTCVGEVRRIVLDQLGNRYGRRFDTHWDFVRFAQEQGLDLDFTTPPKRPDPKLPPLFQE